MLLIIENGMFFNQKKETFSNGLVDRFSSVSYLENIISVYEGTGKILRDAYSLQPVLIGSYKGVSDKLDIKKLCVFIDLNEDHLLSRDELRKIHQYIQESIYLQNKEEDKFNGEFTKFHNEVNLTYDYVSATIPFPETLSSEDMLLPFGFSVNHKHVKDEIFWPLRKYIKSNRFLCSIQEKRRQRVNKNDIKKFLTVYDLDGDKIITYDEAIEVNEIFRSNEFRGLGTKEKINKLYEQRVDKK